ncbi:MAG: hypothetical protein U9N57_11115 [Pseudomonadota bacterium]|nr:hypothetical protein [Pseudomonadota bacterium]
MKIDINQQAMAFDAEEEFESGRHALVDTLQCTLHFKDTSQFSEMAKKLKSDQQKLAAFWFAYFTARLKIEQSYEFTLANQCFDWGLKQLDAVQDPSVKPTSCVLLRAQIAVMLVDEDRGMHNNHFSYTRKSCDKALALIAEQPECQAELAFEIAYIQAVQALSALLEKRDQGVLITEQDWEQIELVLKAAYLKTQPLKIYASVLKAHLASIAYLKKATHSKLVVTDGRLVSSYYATINSMQVDCLISSLENQALRDDLMLKVQAKSFYEPEPPDVLSDMSEGGQFHIWQFDLPDVVLPEFRGGALRYGLSLRFNSLGLAQLHFEADLAGIDVNHVRHLINLPLENALDEKVEWQEQVGLLYLRDVADYLFSQIDDWFGQGSSLIYSTSEHVSNTLLLETIQDSASPELLLSFQQVQEHPDWLGLTVPPREVRSAFENWRVQTPHKGVKNIAQDLYHSDDWVQTDGSYALIVQLQQPSWVTSQALENVQVATGARFYMKQLGKMLFENVRSVQLEYHDDEDIDNKTRYELREQEKEYRRRVKQLHLLNLEVRDLLHLMDTGGLMRFPDHGRFVQQLFASVGVNEERDALQDTMKESQETTRFLRVQISNALDKLSEKSSQRFDAVVGFMGILLSVTAFSDMFDLIEETGTDIPALVEMEVVFGAMILIVLYFSIEAIIRRIK